ncbi:MAG: hypothetical protein CMJ64_17460 [Planctomycetaceae bacterium]|nr:hypothetical protein [Planctomycetaceae bacterium]
MSRLKVIDRENWREFLAAPAAVLMLGKSDCEACGKWTEELTAFLDSDEAWTHVRFGKLGESIGSSIAYGASFRHDLKSAFRESLG